MASERVLVRGGTLVESDYGQTGYGGGGGRDYTRSFMGLFARAGLVLIFVALNTFVLTAGWKRIQRSEGRFFLYLLAFEFVVFFLVGRQNLRRDSTWKISTGMALASGVALGYFLEYVQDRILQDSGYGEDSRAENAYASLAAVSVFAVAGAAAFSQMAHASFGWATVVAGAIAGYVLGDINDRQPGVGLPPVDPDFSWFD